MGRSIGIIYVKIELLQQLDLKEKTTVPKQDPMAAIQVTEDLKTFGTPRPPLEKIGKEGYYAGSCSMSVGISQRSNSQIFYPQWIG